MHSMTGFGRAEVERAGDRVSVEVRAVNGKQLDVRFSLPPEYSSIEIELRRRVQRLVSRGSLSVNVVYEPSPEHRRGRFHIDEELAAGAVERLRGLARKLGISEDLSLSVLLTLPGMIDITMNGDADEAVRDLIREAVDAALGALRSMQEREADVLKEQLIGQCRTMRGATERVGQRAGEVVAHWRDRLRASIEKLGVEVAADDERLARELAFHAERSDVTEEITRISTHLVEFDRLLETQDEPVGRTLLFLCQELNREVNTLAAKTRDTESAADVLLLKSSLGKLKEQSANIE